MDHLYDLKIRSMEIKDITQVLAIEKDAFPNLFPSTNFRTEISRNISHTRSPQPDAPAKQGPAQFSPN